MNIVNTSGGPVVACQDNEHIDPALIAELIPDYHNLVTGLAEILASNPQSLEYANHASH